MKINLLIIDPQNDFCDPFQGSLYVEEAEDDIDRLSRLDIIQEADNIFVTGDAHGTNHIASVSWFVDENDVCPLPFTSISVNDKGFLGSDGKTYFPRMEEEWTRYYIKELTKAGKIHTIWPPHCLIGTTGAAIRPALHMNLYAKDFRSKKNTKYIQKGTNPRVEAFSAFEAEIEDPNDPSTKLNVPLIKEIMDCDRVYVAGEALSHCVCESINSIIKCDNNFAQKIYLMQNCTSAVSGFEKKDFLEFLEKQGVNLVEG